MTGGQERTSRPGLDLALRNRRLWARTWPNGTLETCEQIEAKYPDWWVYWRDGNGTKGFEHPAAFAAHRVAGGLARLTVCGVDAESLVAAMERAPDERHWHYENVCCGPRLPR